MIEEYKLNEIYNKDSLEFLKTFDDFTFDINYSDPPYQLGSEVIIRKDGKVDYKKSVDFMNKWGGLSGEYWEQWFKEAYRTLKHGGYCIMFGMDRQLLLFKYYANLAGFEEQQSLYWYFISNFPKATDLSKMIDKNAGAERTKIGSYEIGGLNPDRPNFGTNDRTNGQGMGFRPGDIDITAPSTDLAKKYDGYKYSISPLKQTNETIMVFRKPYKTGSCLHDTLAFENGDNECRCGALNIDGNRVPSNEELGRNNNTNPYGSSLSWSVSSTPPQNNVGQVEGRYPSQTLCNEKTAEVLDKQSGIKVSKVSNKGSIWGSDNEEERIAGHNDTGGCSKILHKCDFEKEDYDIYNYNPKVSKSERNAGCDELEEKEQKITSMYDMERDNGTIREQPLPRKNNHPTLKPIALNEKILKLFKTPNDDKIVFPFAGSGSEVIGGLKAGFTNWVGCEINPDYVEIAKARIDYWTKQDSQLTMFDIERETNE